MDINQIAQFITGERVIRVFFKLFAIVLSFLYLLYTIISIRQIKVMNRTLETQGDTTLSRIAFGQFIGAIIMVFIALVLL